MATVVPTITAENAHIYREQIERIEAFAQRIHIDLMDGEFTPNMSVPAESVWWPDHIKADIHLMFQKPVVALYTLIKLKPALVVVPAESDFQDTLKALAADGIKTGLAVMP